MQQHLIRGTPNEYHLVQQFDNSREAFQKAKLFSSALERVVPRETVQKFQPLSLETLKSGKDIVVIIMAANTAYCTYKVCLFLTLKNID